MRPNIARVVILLTDGKATDKPLTAAQSLTESNTLIYTVGIGEEVDQEELLQIATEKSNNYHVKNYNSIKSIKSSLLGRVCSAVKKEDECDATNTDVMFVLDGSSSVGSSNFTLGLEFMVNVTKRFEVTNGKVRVGVVQYGTTPRTEIELGSTKKILELQEEMQKIKWKYGDTYTAEALRHVYNEMVKKRGSSRKRAIVVITDGNPQDAKNIPGIVGRLKMKNVKLYALGIGHAKRKELEKIAEKDDVYHSDSYSELQKFESSVVRFICKHQRTNEGQYSSSRSGNEIDIGQPKPTYSPESICPKLDLMHLIKNIHRSKRVRGFKEKKYGAKGYRLRADKVNIENRELNENFEISILFRLHSTAEYESHIPIIKIVTPDHYKSDILEVALVRQERLEIVRKLENSRLDRIVFESPLAQKLFNRRYHKITVKTNRYDTVVLIDCKEVEGAGTFTSPIYANPDKGTVQILPRNSGIGRYDPIIDVQELDFLCDFKTRAQKNF